MNTFGIKVTHDNPDFASITCSELLTAIRKNTDIEANKKKIPTVKGTKSTSFSIYELALGAITSGALPSLIDLISSYIQQDKNLEIEITKADGTSFKVNSSNLKPAERSLLISDARKFMDCA